MKRINSIDFIRGFVMIIMALDHVRDLIHVDAITESPTNLATTTPILFFTRWITYLCAPVFVFLAGTSAYLAFVRNNDFGRSRKFLLKRGLYMIVLDLTLVNFLLYFDLKFHTFLFEVIAAIGFGFIVLALLIRVSGSTIGTIGLIIICCHNLLAIIPFEEGSVLRTILSPLFSPGLIPLTPGRVMIIAYPPIPWLGIILTGFAAGKYFLRTPSYQSKLFGMIGITSILLFMTIRAINIYGDSVPWSVQKNGVYTFLSFVNVTKYPPSLVFSLITLGIMFCILAVSAKADGKLKRVVSVYGKVPLFYFLLHFLVIHLVMLGILFLQGFSWNQLDFASGNFGRPGKSESGLELWAIYLIWIIVVILLYPACLWYGRYKTSHTHWWLKYL